MDNTQFLTAIFRDPSKVHVTSFTGDPNENAYWAGGYYENHHLGEGNQYFCVSLFDADEKGVARRRKALFKAIYCIVLDDVKEKLPLEQAQRLPAPSWILETSAGSEQWGYILDAPCDDRGRAENLLDGLVANGLAPNGKDPGMKGVTRYVRLPGGYNSKASKLVDGQPFKCRLVDWQPFSVATMEQLAAPFDVDLDAPRRESRVDGAALVSDHPLLQHPDLLALREERSPGRYEVRCPWVDEHTGAVDNGAAVFTNEDGSMGFKCHHGACEHRTGKDLINYFEEHKPGFTAGYKSWQVMREFKQLAAPSGAERGCVAEGGSAADQLISIIHTNAPGDPEFEAAVESLCKLMPGLKGVEQTDARKEVRSAKGWSESELNRTIKELNKKSTEEDFFSETVYVGEQNQFYDREKRMWYSPDAYSNVYGHLDDEARSKALKGERVTKVDKLDYAPLQPPVFRKGAVTYANAWSNASEDRGAPGDCTAWLNHFDALGWGDTHKHHITQWMAYTIRHPDKKINHALLLGGLEGIGKDFLLYPLVRAMGDNHQTVSGSELLNRFNDFVLNTKHLHINELEPGTDQDAKQIASTLKPMLSAPPEYLRAEAKGVKTVNVRNILNVSITTNDYGSIRLNGGSRRFYALWSQTNVRGEHGTLPAWNQFWREAWPWMEGEGHRACIDYLMKLDISDFHPQEAPPVTQYLRDMAKTA